MNTTTLRLYEIPDAYEAIEAELIENGGELTPALEAMLNALDGVLEDKAERICRIVKNHEGSAQAFDAEIARLESHKSAHTNAAKRLKDYLYATMLRLDRGKIDAGVFKLAIQKNGRPAIAWPLNTEQLPERFRRIRIELDGNAAYEAVKAGEELPAGFIVSHGTHLRIR